MTKLNAIVKDFAKIHRRRATGGRWALAGFHFQFYDSLLRFFQPVAVGQAPDMAVFDSLSDFVGCQDGRYDVTQHKRTLTKPNFREALREFLIVERFLTDSHDVDRVKFNYQIVTSQLDHFDVAMLPELPDTAESARWRSIVDSGRFNGVFVQPDPWAELVKLLWPRVKHPHGVATRCVQHVFDGLSIDLPAKDLRARLLQEYENDKQDRSGSTSPLLTQQDFPRDQEAGNRVLTGQRPQMEDLRAGCFMPRPIYVAKVASELRAILRPEKSHARRKVPVLWITGGSGLGKSVLLLSSLEHVMREEDIECLWSRGSPQMLEETLAKIDNEQVLFAIDDLYAPGWRDPAQWDRISDLAQARRTSLVFLVSSPTEYMRTFKGEQAFSDVFEHRDIEVDSLNSDEQAEYAKWYSLRVGVTINAAMKEPNFVLTTVRYQVQIAGDSNLEDFAVRLWHRLDVLGIANPVAVTLAASRLGLTVPTTLFGSPELQDGLNKLEHDFLFLVSSVR